MRRSKGTGCITAMKDGRYKYRGLIRIGVNKNGNPKNKVFYGNTKKEVEEKNRSFPELMLGKNGVIPFGIRTEEKMKQYEQVQRQQEKKRLYARKWLEFS